MIIVAIIALSLVVLIVIARILNTVPVIPNEFVTIINQVLPYVATGVKFINSFMYPEIVWPLAVACLGLHTFWTGYRIAMWVMKKIPMFGVSD